LFVPYKNPRFWTDRNRTLHTSPPWSARDRRVCMGPQYSTFLTYFVGSECRFVRNRWLPAPHWLATALYLWCGTCWCDVRDGGGLCNENTEKWMECACVKIETWWDGKEVTNELHLQLHCIYTNDNIKPIEPSFVLLFPVYGEHISSPSQTFPLFQWDVLLTGWQHSAAKPDSHMCVCVRSPCFYITSSTSSCFAVSGKCFAYGMTTLWSMLLTWATICSMLESQKPHKHLHSGSWREKQRTSVTFQTDSNIPISLRDFAFLLIVEQDVFFHDAAFFFLHLCGFA
jgi:hypothetical protein